ncbi:MAG: ABC transporter permease [Clostridiales bacterium]|nr:ABC transporter permease [Clostridiales bacterium]
MDAIKEVLGLLFGPDEELRQIIWLTLKMSFFSTTLASALGIPLGVVLGCVKFRGRGIIMRLTTTLMGLPPVVAGLVVFLILSRSGPLGQMRLLYSLTAMVVAQVVLITPIIAGLTANIVGMRSKQIAETALGIGLSPFRRLYYTLYECRKAMVVVLLTGFGRAISEVGAVQMVGGNIQGKTRVMTTTIMMETNMGRFYVAISLGVVLLLIAFAVNSLTHFFQEKET